MTTRTVHFTLDLEQFTNMIRREWAANNQETAMLYLEDMPFTQSEKMAIINGTAKMINDPDSQEDGLLVDDDWNPYDHYSHYGGWGKHTEDFTLWTGWIADNGKFYYAAYGEHEKVAYLIRGLSEREAEQAGWIKITKENFLGKQPNRKQKETLFDWCTANKQNYDYVLKRIFAHSWI